jgi:hypothetical protein
MVRCNLKLNFPGLHGSRHFCPLNHQGLGSRIGHITKPKRQGSHAMSYRFRPWLSAAALSICLAHAAHADNYGGSVQAGAGWLDGTFGIPSDSFSAPGKASAGVDISGTHFTPHPRDSGFSTELGSAVASAQIGPGALHLMAQSAAGASNAVPGVAVGGRASADVSAYLDDSFIIKASALPLGSLVTMAFIFDVHGGLGGAGSSGGWQGSANVAASLHLVGTGSACGCDNVDWSGRQSLSGNQSAYTTNGISPFGDHPFTATVLVGSPINLHITGEAHSSSLAKPDYFIGGSSGATFESNLSNTIGWGGIVNVFDANGHELTDYSAISATSGFDYRQSSLVPEPQTLILMLAGLISIGICRRRRPQ